MPNNYPTTEKTLYVITGSNVIRTGLLEFYDPLSISDISGSILSGLNSTSASTIPATDALDGITLPDYINVNELTLTITTSTG